MLQQHELVPKCLRSLHGLLSMRPRMMIWMNPMIWMTLMILMNPKYLSCLVWVHDDVLFPFCRHLLFFFVLADVFQLSTTSDNTTWGPKALSHSTIVIFCFASSTDAVWIYGGFCGQPERCSLATRRTMKLALHTIVRRSWNCTLTHTATSSACEPLPIPKVPVHWRPYFEHCYRYRLHTKLQSLSIQKQISCVRAVLPNQHDPISITRITLAGGPDSTPIVSMYSVPDSNNLSSTYLFSAATFTVMALWMATCGCSSL